VLAKALSLWRGPALADVPDEFVAEMRQALHEEQLAATETMLEAELALGRYDEVLRELAARIVDHPYRERLHEIKMMALVRPPVPGSTPSSGTSGSDTAADRSSIGRMCAQASAIP
jgi:hypothetical protein